MPKIIKYIGYPLLFIFSFFLFIYWTFPYSVLKDRIVGAVEQQLGSEYDVRIGDISPSFFTGVVLKQVKIIKHDGDNTSTMLEAAKVRVRASIGTLLFGGMNVKFSVKNQKSYFSGSFKNSDEGFSFAGNFDNFNLGDIGFISGGGVKLSSAIDGDVKLNINKRQMLQSTGSAELKLSNIAIKAGEVKLGETAMPVPDIALSKGSGSVLKMELSKGTIKVTEFKLADGDLKLDLTGEMFMSTALKNYRMNLKGMFSVTPKLEQAMPFLFMIEKQKQADGSYPLTLTGRFGQPSVKIGDFVLPI
jgi:type II secretion system protein N